MIQSGYSTPAPAPEKSESPKQDGKKNYRIEARQISNGWIVRECWNEGDKYQEKESYMEKNPIEEEND